MDEYGQVGPDKPDYADDVRTIRELVGDGYPQSIRFAHRSTALQITFVPWPAIDGERNKPSGFATDTPLLVAITRDGSPGVAAFLPTRHWLHPGYVAQYLGWPIGEGDDTIARFLNAVLGHPEPDVTNAMSKQR